MATKQVILDRKLVAQARLNDAKAALTADLGVGDIEPVGERDAPQAELREVMVLERTADYLESVAAGVADLKGELEDALANAE